MDNRWSVRKPVALEVMIYDKGLPIARHRTRDIGMEGIFVETDAGDFQIEGEVEVEVDLGSKRVEGRHRLPAVVKHRSDGGVGLMFSDHDLSVLRAFRNMLYEAPTDTKARSKIVYM